MTANDDITVQRDDAEGRYVLRLGDVIAGFTTFQPDAEGRLVFAHTGVDPTYKGRGLGGVLLAQAMADVAERGETVVPVCPFVRRYLSEVEVPGLAIDWPAESTTG